MDAHPPASRLPSWTYFHTTNETEPSHSFLVQRRSFYNLRLFSYRLFLSLRSCLVPIIKYKHRSVKFRYLLNRPVVHRSPSGPPVPTMKFFSALFSLLAFLSVVLCQSIVTQSDGSVFSYTVSGSVTQTFVLSTTVITSCGPCTPGASASGSAAAPGSSTATPAIQAQAQSAATSLRPQVIGLAGLITGLIFVLA